MARVKVAAILNAEPNEIVFTSCGTESNNSAIQSALSADPQRRHVITTAVEHYATIRFCKQLEKRGVQVTCLPVRPDGALELCHLERAIRPDTAIVSLMWANNETGVVFPIAEIAAICRSKGTLFHTDAVQAPGRIKIGFFGNCLVNSLRQVWDEASLTAGGRELGLGRRPPARFSSRWWALRTTRKA
jgi:cysteine desulfurase